MNPPPLTKQQMQGAELSSLEELAPPLTFLCSHEFLQFAIARKWSLQQVDDFNAFRAQLNKQQPNPYAN